MGLGKIIILLAMLDLCCTLPLNNQGQSSVHNLNKINLGQRSKHDLFLVGHDKHGGIKMGIPDPNCDNALVNLDLDWDNSTDYEYKCQVDEKAITITTQGTTMPSTPVLECLAPENIPDPMHICMDKAIEYTDLPPRGGAHRPLWPVYGEYVYIPPQRWLHALEHGAAVFLYHPCADKSQIELLKNQARSCIRRHVITPYRGLTRDQPFAVLTWGCRLLMKTVSPTPVHHFVKNHAIDTEESAVFADGHFSWGLIKKAEIVSDIQDSDLCPNDKMTEDHMIIPYSAMQ